MTEKRKQELSKQSESPAFVSQIFLDRANSVLEKVNHQNIKKGIYLLFIILSIIWIKLVKTVIERLLWFADTFY